MKQTSFWPWGIVISLVVFMSNTLVFVYLSFQHRVDLVQENYYQMDLNFNTYYEASKRLQSLKEKPQYRLYRNGTLELILPEILTGQESKVELLLYNPTNPALDRKLTLFALQKQQRVTTGPPVMQQKWRIKAQYMVANQLFYDEEPLHDLY